MNSLQHSSSKVPSSTLLALAGLVLFCTGLRAQSQSAYVKASNTDLMDDFGTSMAIAGDTLVIGASTESSNATGVNGNQADNSDFGAGAVYVYVRSGTGWSQQAYLKASNTDLLDLFGTAVAISGDTIVVGAPYESSNATGVNGNEADNSLSTSGAAYVFVRTGTTWTQQAYLKASNTGIFDHFGTSVSISGDTIVVGAVLESSNATGVNGNQSDDSAVEAGAAYVFVRSGTSWTQQAYLKASNTGAGDQFGCAVSIASDTVLIGAHLEDSGATGVNGNQLDNASADAGAVYVFGRSGTTWSQQAYLKASNSGAADEFGISTALSGNTAVIGAFAESSHATGVNGDQISNSAPASGAAYVFVRGATWTQQAYLKASNTESQDRFAVSVALSGERLVVGALGEDSNATGVGGSQGNNSASGSGAAYLFARNGSTWSQEAYLKASNTGAGDQFGLGCCVGDDTLVVGAYGEDSNATGVNGNQSDNSSESAGAAYVFELDPVPTPYCYGDGSGTACPCANSGAAGNGCASSVNANGAHLSGAGAASLANDSFVLTGTGMPNSSALYFQGTAQVNAGAGAVFGDGLRCAGGTVIRLGTKTNASGASAYPAAGDASISIKGQIAAPGVRNYQCWYRNAAAFCSPSTFNLTNGLRVTWVP